MSTPPDPNDYAEALERVVARFQPGCPRWILCAKGWYPLLVRLDERLRAIVPDYVLYGVKEKYATLRYDAEPATRGADYFSEPSPDKPDPPTPDALAANHAAVEAWSERVAAWLETPEYDALEARYWELLDEIDAVVREAEAESARTCEICGEPGVLRSTGARDPWFATYCDEHAAGYPVTPRGHATTPPDPAPPDAPADVER